MNRLLFKLLLIVAVFTLIYPSLTKAKVNLSSREDVLVFVQAAFQAQLSLGEEGRTMDEIDKILTPFFTDESKKIFLEENLFQENELFITYGTDFPFYYIPYFSYSNETKIAWEENEIYLYEFFPDKNEGPVSYESHYEGVKLVKYGDLWKIAEFLYNDLPDELMKQDEQKKDSSLPIISKDTYFQKKLIQSSLQYGLCMNPLEFLFKYGGFCSTEKLAHQ